VKKYIGNPHLKYVKSGFKGNEISDNVFQNLYGQAAGDSLWQVLKWRFSRNPQRAIKKAERYVVPVRSCRSVLQDTDDYLLWLGHASWLMQIDGKKILTDPCLSSPLFGKRHTELPLPIDSLKPDYLLVSHGHYDHLDMKSLKYCSGATALIPLNMAGLIRKANPDIQCCEAGWYQQYDLAGDFQITFLPAYHWHRRGSFDYNKVLWGSFLVKTRNRTIYFGGDSGYSPHFRDIGDLFGGVDIAILSIGAYAPRWFMRTSHTNPEEALLAARDLRAKRLIPMHYGTFDLSDEPLGEPEQRLREIAGPEEVTFLTIGEKFPFFVG